MAELHREFDSNSGADTVEPLELDKEQARALLEVLESRLQRSLDGEHMTMDQLELHLERLVEETGSGNE